MTALPLPDTGAAVFAAAELATEILQVSPTGEVAATEAAEPPPISEDMVISTRGKKKGRR